MNIPPKDANCSQEADGERHFISKITFVARAAANIGQHRWREWLAEQVIQILDYQLWESLVVGFLLPLLAFKPRRLASQGAGRHNILVETVAHHQHFVGWQLQCLHT